ncbi:hypothetical protein N8642_03930, partial [bacterium]|nr:hypothetical protein [bacterium]
GRVPGQSDEVAWVTVSFDQLGWEKDVLSTGMAAFLSDYKSEQDYWQFTGKRLPTVGGAFTSTYIALAGIERYGDGAVASRERVARAHDWLKNNQSFDTEDQVYRLRSLSLLGDEEAAEFEALKLLSSQRSDGGWAQLPQMDSDAYATSTTLSVLVDSEFLKPEEHWYQRGLSYLLDTQKADGSWQVTKRARVVQPHYESGYPGGEDQFISVVAASWAIYSMVKALPSEGVGYRKPYLVANPDVQQQIVDQGSAEEPEIPADQIAFFEAKVRPVLEANCYSCHSRKAEKLKADLFLDSREGMLLGGENGPAIVPRDPKHSLLMMALKGDTLSEMPPKKPLASNEIRDLETWIAMGAPDPRTDPIAVNVASSGVSAGTRSSGGFRRRGEGRSRGQGRDSRSRGSARQQEWTDANGDIFKSALLRIEGDIAIMQREDGERHDRAVESLSKESQDRIRARMERVRGSRPRGGR